MSDGFRVARDGAVVRLTLTRPEAGNLLTLAMIDDIAAAVRVAGGDPGVNVIVLTGEGDDFCKGRDPAGAPEGNPTTALEMRAALMEPILGLYGAIRTAAPPVLSAAKGLVNGLGCGITAVCDLTVAADDARFALPEMRANLPPTLAMLAHLDRIPPKSLLGMVYSTEPIDAATARAIGLVGQIVPAAELDATVEALAAKLAGYDREAVVTCKAYLQKALKADYAAANDLAGNVLANVLSSRRK